MSARRLSVNRLLATNMCGLRTVILWTLIRRRRFDTPDEYAPERYGRGRLVAYRLARPGDAVLRCRMSLVGR